MVQPRLLIRFLALVTVLWTVPGILGAQDTRGSLVPGSKVLLMDGTSAKVEDLSVGSVIWTWAPPAVLPVPGKITAVRPRNTDFYLLVKAGPLTLLATGAHRIALAGGKLARLDTLTAGDQIWVWNGVGPEAVPVTSIRELPATILAYDLTVEGHRIFQVNGVLVGD